MTRVIMYGCNGKMGQTITRLIEEENDVEIVAGIDVCDTVKNSYPVFTDIDACQVEADALIDFSSAKAILQAYISDFGFRLFHLS